MNPILIFTLFLFTVLNFAPFFMINCVETNGNNHIENLLTRCCTSSMPHMNNMASSKKSLSINQSHCLCSVNITGGEYILPNHDKYIPDLSFNLNEVIKEEIISENEDFPVYNSESPPISINLVRTTVILI